MAMNMYTLDPPKSESTAPSAPAHESAPVPVSAPVHASTPFYMFPNYPYYPYQYPQPPVVPTAEIHKIRDWLPWSIINLFIGGLLFGLLPLIFSIICRSNKKKNNVASAKTMSTLALVFNIMVTVVSVIVAIGLFIYLFVYTQQLRSSYFINS